VSEYLQFSGRIQLRRIFDNNGIQLAVNNNFSANFRTMSPEEFLGNYNLMSREQAYKLMSDPLERFKQGIFVVKYKI
jgi:hypothetical protein